MALNIVKCNHLTPLHLKGLTVNAAVADMLTALSSDLHSSVINHGTPHDSTNTPNSSGSRTSQLGAN